MSKIAKALERARQESHDAPDARREEAYPGHEAFPLDDGSPVYTRTKVVSPDDSLLRNNRILTHVQDTFVQDHYSLLRTQVLQRTREQGLNTIMVTSVGRNEGKTTTAVNLAISMAREVGQTSLLVDLDLRAPDVGRYLGFAEERGISDFLISDVSVRDLFVNPGVQKIVVLPAGRALTATTELLGSPKMKNLVRELKQRYPDRYVFFDCPPFIDNPDSMVFSSYVDGILLVIEADRTPKRLIHQAVSMLSPEKLLGLVYNKARISPRI